MGNDNSVMISEDTPPQTLDSRSVDAIAKYIKEKNVRRIVVMNGAGASTSAGIPDFRSPDTGLYANLARLDLPHPEAVFDISYFRKNPRPFYSLSRDMFPGRFRPTVAHSFVKLLYDKGRLLKLFTQNIDCLDRQAGLPGEMIVEAHGSYATHSCIDCKAPYPEEMMKKAVEAQDVPLCPDCMGVVKPDIVFFGEALPESFVMNRTLPAAADLCIVMGSSLSVQPFASLPSMCREETPRILINLHQAGGMGSRADDVLLLGECDAGVRKLADALGWREELEALWAATAPEGGEQRQEGEEKEGRSLSRDERLGDEVDRLTKDVDQSLHISNVYDQKVRDQLRNSPGKNSVQDTNFAKYGSEPDKHTENEAESRSRSPSPDDKNKDKDETPSGASQARPAGETTADPNSDNQDKPESTTAEPKKTSAL